MYNYNKTMEGHSIDGLFGFSWSRYSWENLNTWNTDELQYGLNIEVGFTDPNWNFPGLSPIINEIRRERRIELALEGFRYDDMMRWAAYDLVKGKRWKGAKCIKGIAFPAIEDQIADLPVDENGYIDRYQRDIPNGFGFDEKRDYLYPLPITELTLNQNLERNPGW